jgi:phospholipid/cholesterol/gamma-HCH transport system substrate-binding protein
MHLSKRIQVQLAVFAVLTLVAGGIMSFAILGLPNLLFGVGHYQVTMDLPQAGGLYQNANVTYRGTEVGQVKALELTPGGVRRSRSIQTWPFQPILTRRSTVKRPRASSSSRWCRAVAAARC